MLALGVRYGNNMHTYSWRTPPCDNPRLESDDML